MSGARNWIKDLQMVTYHADVRAMVCASQYHTVLLRSDGQALACGSKQDGKCDISRLNHGESYTDSAIFHLWRKECATHKLLLAGFILCFSDRMEMLWLVETMNTDNATFQC